MDRPGSKTFVLFSPEIGNLYTQLTFPALLYAALPDGRWSSGEIQPETTSILAEAVEWLEAIQRFLRKYQEGISRFYTRSFSLPEVLLPLLPLDGKTRDQWLGAAQAKTDRELRQVILKAVWPHAANLRIYPNPAGTPMADGDEAAGILVDADASWLYYLQQVGLPSADAWLVYNFLDQPQKSLEELADLFKSLTLIESALISSRWGEVSAALEQELGYLQAQQDRMLLLSDSLQAVLGGDDEELHIMPSLEPLVCRPLVNQHALLVGFALASLWREEDLEAEVKRQANQAFCQSLADPTRYNLCCLLAQGKQKQKDLARALQVSQATVSHHLAVLREQGLLTGGHLNRAGFQAALEGLADDLQIYGA